MSLMQPLLGSNLAGGASFDPDAITNSVWYDGSADRMAKTFSSGSAQSELVFATWFQRCNLTTEQVIFNATGGTGGSSRNNRIVLNGDDTFEIHTESSTAATTTYNTSTTGGKLKDVGWYHCIVSFKGDAGSNSVKLFINGVEQTLTINTGSAFTGSLSSFGNAAEHEFAELTGTGIQIYKGYLAQSVMLVGQSVQGGDVAVTDFLDEVESRFVPRADADVAALASTAGGNSFCLDYSNSSDLGNDISSNNNDFTLTSMDSANQVAHSPSRQFPIYSYINGNTSNSVVDQLEFGNRLQICVSDWRTVLADKMFGSTGKWYMEVRLHNDTASNGFIIGFQSMSTGAKAFNDYIGNSSTGDGYSMYTHSYRLRHNGANTSLKAGVMGAGDIIQLAIDCDNNNMWMGDDNTWIGASAGTSNPATATNATATGLTSGAKWVFGNSTSASEDYFINFGQDSTFGGNRTAGNQTDANGIGDFVYAPPSGYLCCFQSNKDNVTFSNPETGSFEGNANTNGPFVFLGFQPSPSDALTINSNAVTYGTHVDLCSNGFKVRSSSSSYNSTGTNNWSLVTANALQTNGDFPPPYGILN